MSNEHDQQLPEDLKPVVEWLRAQRPTADPVVLDQIKLRAMIRADTTTRGHGSLKQRLATIFTVLGLLGGTSAAFAVADDGGGHGNEDASKGMYTPGYGCGSQSQGETNQKGQKNDSTACDEESQESESNESDKSKSKSEGSGDD